MTAYLIRRLLLLPFTLFFIILINFIIINLSPGDPATMVEISDSGEATAKENQAVDRSSEDKYLRFREHFGLTLPILYNPWYFIEEKQVLDQLKAIASYPEKGQWSFKQYHQKRVLMGDQARFIMPHLLIIIQDSQHPLALRSLASGFFIRGANRQGKLGPGLTAKEKQENRKIADDNYFLSQQRLNIDDSPPIVDEKLAHISAWYEKNQELLHFQPGVSQKYFSFVFETRFYRYMNKVLTLDFGTIKNDDNKRVIDEVYKRFKYSLTLALLPMLITFFLCMALGIYMAVNQNTYKDVILNVIFLSLYAVPVFVVGPFLIEKIALHYHFPFTQNPIPISGFHSPEETYQSFNSWQRLWDVVQHLVLPLVSIMYGSLAAQTRIARTAVLEVLRQNYVRTAKAKGLKNSRILWIHVGKNASITIVTSVAGSLGVIIGGSLIVETIFGINGFGKFFYEAILNYDYNVIMFSVIAGSFLTLLGYLVADISYTLLDPRVTLD